MQGAELSSFHDGRFPIISIGMSFQSGHTMCFNLFANKFSEKSREISAPATSKEHSFPQQYVILIRLIVQHTNANSKKTSDKERDRERQMEKSEKNNRDLSYQNVYFS